MKFNEMEEEEQIDQIVLQMLWEAWRMKGNEIEELEKELEEEQTD